MSKYTNLPGKIVVCGNTYECFDKNLDIYTNDPIYHFKSKNSSEILYLMESDLEHINRASNGEVKDRVTLVEPEFIRGMAKVLEMGADKHGERSYRGYTRDMVDSRLDSAYRHLLNYIDGNKVDEESGLNNILHLAVNCMIIYYHDKEGGL